MCNRSLKKTAISLSSCEEVFYTASSCARAWFGLTELFKELHYNVSVRLGMDSNSERHIVQRRGPGGLKHIEIRCLAMQQMTREKHLSLSRVDTKNNTADFFTKHLYGLRTPWLAKKLGLRILDGTKQGVSVLSFHSWHDVHYPEIDLCTLTSFITFFLFSSVCPQTNTAQWCTTQ